MGMVNGWANVYQRGDGQWVQGSPSEDDQMITEAVAETQRELLDSAFDRDPDERTGIDHDLEDVEGWDGDPLSLAEIAHTSIHGWDEDANYDRPLQRAAENILTQDVQALRAERDLYANSLAEIASGPEARYQQQTQFNDNLLNQFGVAALHDNGEKIMGAINEAREDTINHSMKAAHLEHGDDFVDAFNGLMDTGNQALTAQITSARDPGGALMNWYHGSPGASGGSNRGFMPSLNSGENSGYRGQPSRGGRGRTRDIAEQRGGWGDEATEQDIFNSVWD